MTTNQINSLAGKRTNPVITIYSPTNGIVQGTESMTTAAGSMQNSSTTTSSLTLKEGDYIKKMKLF
jgi:Cu(I)/Ag(I) efflux system membrane fusion protein